MVKVSSYLKLVVNCPTPRSVEPDKSSLWMDLFSLHSVIFIVVTCNCRHFHGREICWSTVCANSKPEKGSKIKPALEIGVYICTICKVHSILQTVPVMAHQLVVFLVLDPSLLRVAWSCGHNLQWQKNALAASQWCLLIVEPTKCQRQRIFMNENQTYRLGSQTSCSIVKFLVY